MLGKFKQIAVWASTLIVFSQLCIPGWAADEESRVGLDRPKIALALGGGGARGAAHIGVLRVLEQEKIPIDYIAGTSIGAIVGGLYAAGVPLSTLEKLSMDRSLLRAYRTMPIFLRLMIIPITVFPRSIGIHPYVGLYSGGRFRKYLERCIPDDCTNIENTKRPFRAVATDLLTGNPYVCSKGSLSKAMQASSAIPWLKKPVEMDDALLCDGVLSANIPVRQAREMGADVVISVDIDGPLQPAKKSELRRIGFFENRSISLMMTKLDTKYVEESDVLIRPDVSKIHILSKHLSEVSYAIAEGERATREALPKIRQLLNRKD
ncbi:MAG: patatin-like phospholipase family protein [Cyanobacteria bacterium]|nr:patatin-like phospholipase family protein [Cyanobacteriota bacterium]